MSILCILVLLELSLGLGLAEEHLFLVQGHIYIIIVMPYVDLVHGLHLGEGMSTQLEGFVIHVFLAEIQGIVFGMEGRHFEEELL